MEWRGKKMGCQFKNTSLRRIICIGFSCAGILLGLYVALMCLNLTPAAAPLPEQELSRTLRLRIIANSSIPMDQQIKNEVAITILENFAPAWRRYTNRDLLYSLLAREQKDIGKTASRILRKNGFKDDVAVHLGKSTFPARLYAGKYYPPGEYEALVVTIGAGKGKNWWCVIFPPLCFAVFPAPPRETEKNSTATAAAQVEETAAEVIVAGDAVASGCGAGGETSDTRVKEEKGKWRFWLFELLRF
jgi:stage II sporulation protein R